jgi:hypothetical protein
MDTQSLRLLADEEPAFPNQIYVPRGDGVDSSKIVRTRVSKGRCPEHVADTKRAILKTERRQSN